MPHSFPPMLFSAIPGVKWQNMITSTEAVQVCKSSDFDTLIIVPQMRQQSHTVHVPEGSIPFLLMFLIFFFQ